MTNLSAMTIDKTDRELLELAAKASGIRINERMQAERDSLGYGDVGLWTVDGSIGWNPLTDDGHALRLAVKLWLVVDPGGNGYPSQAEVKNLDGTIIFEPHGNDQNAAVRRAIVRAAAVTAAPK